MMNNTHSTTTSREANRASKKFDLKAKISEIPDKLGFKIGEVAKYVGVKSYVLRYWETEFESLRPKKSGNGQRFYTRKDIEMALTIRKLLYEDRFSIEGAKAALKKMKSMARTSQSAGVATAPPAKVITVAEDTPITIETTESELLASHRPAAEIVFNKSKTQIIADKVALHQELKQQLHPQHSPTQEALQKREKEITQFWVSSLDYLVEEIRQARKRLLDIA